MTPSTAHETLAALETALSDAQSSMEALKHPSSHGLDGCHACHLERALERMRGLLDRAFSVASRSAAPEPQGEAPSIFDLYVRWRTKRFNERRAIFADTPADAALREFAEWVDGLRGVAPRAGVGPTREVIAPIDENGKVRAPTHCPECGGPVDFVRGNILKPFRAVRGVSSEGHAAPPELSVNAEVEALREVVRAVDTEIFGAQTAANVNSDTYAGKLFARGVRAALAGSPTGDPEP